MQIQAQILFQTPEGEREWSAKQYLARVELAGARPRVFGGLYPTECESSLLEAVQAYQWSLETQPSVKAFRLISGDYTHEERAI